MRAEPRAGVVNLKAPLPIDSVDQPKVGDRWESSSTGLGFTVKTVTATSVTVKVDRMVRTVIEVRERVVPITGWDSFARPYRKLKT